MTAKKTVLPPGVVPFPAHHHEHETVSGKTMAEVLKMMAEKSIPLTACFDVFCGCDVSDVCDGPEAALTWPVYSEPEVSA